MGLESFSQQLKRGLDDRDPVLKIELQSAAIQEPALSGLSVAELRRSLRDPELGFREQDDLWAAILRCYRHRPRAGWGALVLELLAPALVEIAIGFVPRPPAIDAEDLQQQVVLQALDAARTIPLEGERFVKRWLVLEVRRRIDRWLKREAGRGALAVDEAAPAVVHTEDEAWEFTEVLVSHPHHDDLELLYRLEVVGETFEEVARDLGCTANAVECWRRRARARLQRQLAA